MQTARTIGAWSWMLLIIAVCVFASVAKFAAALRFDALAGSSTVASGRVVRSQVISRLPAVDAVDYEFTVHGRKYWGSGHQLGASKVGGELVVRYMASSPSNNLPASQDVAGARNAALFDGILWGGGGILVAALCACILWSGRSHRAA